MRVLLAVWICLTLVGCSFDADLDDYLVCGPDGECGPGCTCSSENRCLPELGMSPGQCDPNGGPRDYLPCDEQADCFHLCDCDGEHCLPSENAGLAPGDCYPPNLSSLKPGELLRLNWTDSIATRGLTVDSPDDRPGFLPAAVDFDSALAEALADDGLICLREAVQVAELAGVPVRIDFDPLVFPPGAWVEIVLETTLEIRTDNLLIDGRGAGVHLTGLEESDMTEGLWIEADTVAVVDLALRGFPGRALRLRRAQGIYLSGLTIESNDRGLFIDLSSLILLSDGSELPGIEAPGRNHIRYNGAFGISLVDVSDLLVVGTDLRSNLDDSIRINGNCTRMVFGPPPGFDHLPWSHVVISDSSRGFAIDGFSGELLVRNTVLEDNNVDVFVADSTGWLGFFHVTVANSYHAVFKYTDGPGTLILVLHNSILHSIGMVQHVFCYGDGSTLELSASHVMFSHAPNFLCATYPEWNPDVQHWVANPEFLDAAGGDFHLAVGSPALDVGVEQQVNEHLLDLNGPMAERSCLAGPDLGAYEFCP